MAFEFDLNKVKESIMDLGKDVGDRAKEATTIVKIKADIHSKEEFLEKQYAQLGRAYYEAHHTEDVPEQEHFATIEEAENELQRLNDELLSVQGAIVCEKCGTKQSNTHAFCEKCGAQLEDIVDGTFKEDDIFEEAEAEESTETDTTTEE